MNVAMIFALSQGPNKLRRFARQHNVFEDGPNRNIGEVLQGLCEITLWGGELAKEIGKDLDERFRSTLLRVRSLDAEEVKKLEMKWPLPLLWATMRDEREEVRLHGRSLAHALIWRALREMFVSEETGSESEEAVKSLQAQNKTQAAELQNLRQELEKKRVEVESMRRVSRLLNPVFGSPKREKMGQGRLEREIKKLGHELNREREKVRELTEKLSGSNGSSPALEPVASDDVENAGCLSPGDCPCQEETGPAVCVELCREEGTLCGECPLGGLRVAVVGGIQRMLPAYREIVSQLGAEFLFHDGKVKNGRYRLKNIVCGADIVVFITTVNSHGALDVVKAVCKKNGKKFIAPKETGPESLSRLLRACCA
jgi:hypothetical protein